VKQLWIVFFLAILHTLPLWNSNKNLAGAAGDPFAHAAIGEWYCKNVVTGNFQSDIYMSPYGMNMAGNYDSPFPFILTCPFVPAGPLFQFHLFTILQILLIVLSAWLVAQKCFQYRGLQFCYIFFVWWCGFYVVRTHQHMNLLSLIWGFQFILYAFWTFHPRHRKSVVVASLLTALSFAGTFYNIASLLFIVFVLFSYKLWATRKEFSLVSLLNLLIGLGCFLAVFVPLWGPMIYFTLLNGAPDVMYQRSLYNLDLLSPFIPYEGNWLYSFIQSDFKLGFERYNPFDWVMIALAAVSICSKTFWKDPWKVLLLLFAMFYFVMALGPEFRFANETYADLDFNKTLLDIFPFRLSRTPGRFAAITNFCFIFLGFAYLDQIKKEITKKRWSYLLFVWILITGPLLNQMWMFPTLEYAAIFPQKGLASLSSMAKEATVVSIPSAWAQDPTQNFNRLFHHHNISSAYLSYPAYNRPIIASFAKDPFLGKLGCDGEITAFSKTTFMASSAELQKYLREKNLRGFVINKQILLGQANCKALTAWVVEFLKMPWLRVTEENSTFVTAELL
jgi:hypothetical protein